MGAGRCGRTRIVADHEPDPELLADDAAWAACIAGAVTRERYRAQLTGAGFADIEITDSHPVADGFWSVLVRASNPAGLSAGDRTGALVRERDRLRLSRCRGAGRRR